MVPPAPPLVQSEEISQEEQWGNYIIPHRGRLQVSGFLAGSKHQKFQALHQLFWLGIFSHWSFLAEASRACSTNPGSWRSKISARPWYDDKAAGEAYTEAETIVPGDRQC